MKKNDNQWVKLYRQLLDWEWYLDKNVKIMFLHLLLKASYEENRWMGYTIKPGQLITGRKKLAKETGLSEQEVRTSLSKLKKTGEINQQATNQYSIITICNWESYQFVKNENIQTSTSNQPASNQQSTTTKEYKEGKEIEKEETTVGQPDHVKEIIGYLNSKSGKSFKHTTKKTKDLIKARMGEGFTTEDFKRVIDNKVSQWLSDSEMNQYLRPETLFGTKFESYLNTKISNNGNSSKIASSEEHRADTIANLRSD